MPDQLLSDLRRKPFITERDAILENVAGDLSNADRDVLATASQELIVRIPFAWTEKSDQYISPFVLGDTLKLKVRMADASDIVQTDDNTLADPVISNLKMRCNIYHLEESEQAEIYRKSQIKGCMYLWKQTKFQKFTVPPSTGTPSPERGSTT